MHISTKTRYATRALLELALHEGPGALTLQEVAARQEISLKYLETLFNALRNAGLVVGVRGPHGGYRLARAPQAISLREVYELFEGRDGFVACTMFPDRCSRACECATRGVWADLYAHSLRFLGDISLADLAARSHNRALVADESTMEVGNVASAQAS